MKGHDRLNTQCKCALQTKVLGNEFQRSWNCTRVVIDDDLHNYYDHKHSIDTCAMLCLRSMTKLFKRVHQQRNIHTIEDIMCENTLLALSFSVYLALGILSKCFSAFGPRIMNELQISMGFGRIHKVINRMYDAFASVAVQDGM